jgi:hypothetical protein
MEFVIGVKEPTEDAPALDAELPVEDWTPAIVYPEISSTQTEPMTTAPKAALIVSPPELAAVVYQM